MGFGDCANIPDPEPLGATGRCNRLDGCLVEHDRRDCARVDRKQRVEGKRKFPTAALVWNGASRVGLIGGGTHAAPWSRDALPASC